MVLKKEKRQRILERAKHSAVVNILPRWMEGDNTGFFKIENAGRICVLNIVSSKSFYLFVRVGMFGVLDHNNEPYKYMECPFLLEIMKYIINR